MNHSRLYQPQPVLRSSRIAWRRRIPSLSVRPNNLDPNGLLINWMETNRIETNWKFQTILQNSSIDSFTDSNIPLKKSHSNPFRWIRLIHFDSNLIPIWIASVITLCDRLLCANQWDRAQSVGFTETDRKPRHPPMQSKECKCFNPLKSLEKYVCFPPMDNYANEWG